VKTARSSAAIGASTVFWTRPGAKLFRCAFCQARLSQKGWPSFRYHEPLRAEATTSKSASSTRPNPAGFSWADDFHEGLALARSMKTGNKLGFIDRRGQWVMTPRFDWAEPFSEGVAAVDIGGMRGFVDRAGRFPVPLAFAEVHSFSGGLALAYQESCKPLFIDRSGKVVISAPVDFASAFRDGLSIVGIGGRCGVGGTFGYMDTSGALTIAPRYESVAPFSEGLAAVRAGGKWGFINRKGVVVIPVRFEDTAGGAPGPFRSGLARVYSRIPDNRPPNASALADLQSGYIDTRGEYVWSPTY
jgi:WG repeat protein